MSYDLIRLKSDESDRNYEKKLFQAKELYKKILNGEDLNLDQLKKILKYSKNIVNNDELQSKNTKIESLCKKINELQSKIKENKKLNRILEEKNNRILEEKNNRNNRILEEKNNRILELSNECNNLLVKVKVISKDIRYFQLKNNRNKEIINDLDIRIGILKNDNKILKQKNSNYLFTSKITLSWKNACHKLLKLLEDIKRLTSHDTILELCSHIEYIEFPDEITKRSMIESGVGYNPEDSFNPLDYQ